MLGRSKDFFPPTDSSEPRRAGGALHLACAEQAGATSMATLDAVLGRNALRLKIKPVVFA